MATLTAPEVKAVIVENLPAIDQHGEIVERVDDEELQVRTPFRRDILVRTPGTPEALSIPARWSWEWQIPRCTRACTPRTGETSHLSLCL